MMAIRTTKGFCVCYAFVRLTIQCLCLSCLTVFANHGLCGTHVLGSSRGVITSPGYPASGSMAADCRWEIRGEPGSLIILRFDDFDLEEDVDCLRNHADVRSCCSCSWLKIGTVEDEWPVPMCGRNKTLDAFQSTRPGLWLKYHTVTTAAPNTARGFKVSYLLDYQHQSVPQSCRWNETTCYPNSQDCHPKCDHVMHCANGADEMGCVKGCQGRIMCESWNGCYLPDERCNGITQCGDHSDERNCSPELCRSERGGFLCNNRQCIRESWQCDQTNDCGDESDETSCLKSSVITAAIMGSLICGLLLVVAVGCTCKLYALRYGDSACSTRSTMPLSPLEQEILSREPPPPYSVAVLSQSSELYCPQGASHPQAPPHLLDPFQYARLCRGSHHRRSRRSRRTRRRPPTPPACTVVTEVSGIVFGDQSVSGGSSGDCGSHPHLVPVGLRTENLGYVPSGGGSSSEDACTDKCHHVHAGSVAEDGSSSVPTVHSLVVPSGHQGQDCRVNNESNPSDYVPVVFCEVLGDDDDDRPLMIA